MKNKLAITTVILFTFNILMMSAYVKSCQNHHPDRGLTKKVNVSKPAKNIEDRSEQQKSLADIATKFAPSVEPEMEQIKDHADANIKDAKTIQGLQKIVDEKDAAHNKTKDELQAEKEAHAETKESLEKAHNNTLIKILGILVAAGLVGLAGGIGLIAFTFYTQQKFSKMGLIIAVSGGAIAGLGIFTIYYLKTIAITVGAMVAIAIVLAILKVIATSRAQKESRGHKKVAEKNQQIVHELIDTFDDDRSVAKGKHSLELKQMVVDRKFATENKG